MAQAVGALTLEDGSRNLEHLAGGPYLCLVAAKLVYFGVGGGVNEFMRAVSEGKEYLEGRRLWRFDWYRRNWKVERDWQRISRNNGYCVWAASPLLSKGSIRNEVLCAAED